MKKTVFTCDVCKEDNKNAIGYSATIFNDKLIKIIVHPDPDMTDKHVCGMVCLSKIMNENIEDYLKQLKRIE